MTDITMTGVADDDGAVKYLQVFIHRPAVNQHHSVCLSNRTAKDFSSVSILSPNSEAETKEEFIQNC